MVSGLDTSQKPISKLKGLLIVEQQREREERGRDESTEGERRAEGKRWGRGDWKERGWMTRRRGERARGRWAGWHEEEGKDRMASGSREGRQER